MFLSRFLGVWSTTVLTLRHAAKVLRPVGIQEDSSVPLCHYIVPRLQPFVPHTILIKIRSIGSFLHHWSLLPTIFCPVYLPMASVPDLVLNNAHPKLSHMLILPGIKGIGRIFFVIVRPYSNNILWLLLNVPNFLRGWDGYVPLNFSPFVEQMLNWFHLPMVPCMDYLQQLVQSYFNSSLQQNPVVINR